MQQQMTKKGRLLNNLAPLHRERLIKDPSYCSIKVEKSLKLLEEAAAFSKIKKVSCDVDRCFTCSMMNQKECLDPNGCSGNEIDKKENSIPRVDEAQLKLF